MISLEGRVFSACKITGEAGRGAMGVVYRGENLHTGEPVAIKFIDGGAPDLSQEKREESVLRFTDEINALSKVQSPWIVGIKGSGSDPDFGTYLITEFLEGSDLEECVRGGIHYSGNQFIEKVANPLLTGLSDLHKAGIVHRDIKPSNLIARKDGTFIVSDFGLAVFSGRKARTRTGVVVGTPGFMAPETFEAHHGGGRSSLDIGIRGDIYSAGILLIWVLARNHPFRGSTLSETLRNQTTFDCSSRGIRVFAAKNGGTIGEKTATILSRAVARNPEQRYGNTIDFRDELKKAVLFDLEHSDSQMKTVESVSSSDVTKNLTVSKLPSDFASQRRQRASSKVPKGASKGKRLCTKPGKDSSFRRWIISGVTVIVLFFLTVYLSGIFSGKDSSNGDEVAAFFVEDSGLLDSYNRYVASLKRVGRKRYLPLCSDLTEFQERCEQFYKRLLSSSAVKPQLRKPVWDKANGDVTGLPLLLLSNISRKISGERGLFDTCAPAHTEFRVKARKYLQSKSPLLPVDYREILDTELWFVQFSVYCMDDNLESGWFEKILNLLRESELFIAEILPSSYCSIKNQKVTAKTMSAVSLQAFSALARVFLYKVAVLAGRIPVKPWKKHETVFYLSKDEREKDLLRDASNALLMGIGAALSNVEGTNNDLLQLNDDVDQLARLLAQDPAFPMAVGRVNADIAPVKISSNKEGNGPFQQECILSDENPVFTGFHNMEGTPFSSGFIGKYSLLLQSVESRIQHAIPGRIVKPGTREYEDNALSVKCAILTGQRALWFGLSFTTLNTLLSKPVADHLQHPAAYVLCIKRLSTFLDERPPMSVYVKNSDIAPCIDGALLASVTVLAAASIIKFSPQNLHSGASDSQVTSEALLFQQDLVSSIDQLYEGFKELSKTEEERFTSVFERYNMYWENIVQPHLNHESLTYLHLMSKRYFSSAYSADEKKRELAFSYSKEAFSFMRAQIKANGGGDCPFVPYIALLREIVDLRWDYLRRSERYGELTNEAQWVLDTFHKTIAEQVAKDKQFARLRIYSKAAVNVGHISLKNRDEKEFHKAKVYLERVRDEFANRISESTFRDVETVLSGKTVY